ncbi:hypothetical protein Sjap_006988 [Stephania japonica]|uniref:Uncharacterized protein n=1 Tax=Stephania japonica TaxID=461633 RepID=A0AAP0PMG6_9MAGN
MHSWITIRPLHVFTDPDIDLAFQDLGVCNGKWGELSYTMLTKEGDIEAWYIVKLQKKHCEIQQIVLGVHKETDRSSWKDAICEIIDSW